LEQDFTDDSNVKTLIPFPPSKASTVFTEPLKQCCLERRKPLARRKIDFVVSFWHNFSNFSWIHGIFHGKLSPAANGGKKCKNDS
jgi:hypothetical protein